MDWNQVLSVFAVMVTNLVTVLVLYFQLDKKMETYNFQLDKKVENYNFQMDKKIDENRRETTAILKAIQSEIRDFHGRLSAIEERNKK